MEEGISGLSWKVSSLQPMRSGTVTGLSKQNGGLALNNTCTDTNM